MDARDRSLFADESFDFVMFSWNGIDSVDHEYRGRVRAKCIELLPSTISATA